MEDFFIHLETFRRNLDVWIRKAPTFGENAVRVLTWRPAWRSGRYGNRCALLLSFCCCCCCCCCCCPGRRLKQEIGYADDVSANFGRLFLSTFATLPVRVSSFIEYAIGWRIGHLNIFRSGCDAQYRCRSSVDWSTGNRMWTKRWPLQYFVTLVLCLL